MQVVIINGIECMLFEGKRFYQIRTDDRARGYSYVYELRHADDDFTKPVTVERRVRVNFFGTILAQEPFVFGRDGYVEITSLDRPYSYDFVNQF